MTSHGRRAIVSTELEKGERKDRIGRTIRMSKRKLAGICLFTHGMLTRHVWKDLPECDRRLCRRNRRLQQRDGCG